MTATGQVESWVQDPSKLGPLYPFVGWETALFLVCIAICVALTVWKIVHEKNQHAVEARDLRESGNGARIFGSASADGAASEDN